MSTNGSTVFEEQSRHVLRNNTSRRLRCTTMIRNYVRRDVGQPPGRTDKVLEAGVQTSYDHSSINECNKRTPVHQIEMYHLLYLRPSSSLGTKRRRLILVRSCACGHTDQCKSALQRCTVCISPTLLAL